MIVDEGDEKHQDDADSDATDLLAGRETCSRVADLISMTLMTEISSTRVSRVQSKSRKEEKRCGGEGFPVWCELRSGAVEADAAATCGLRCSGRGR